MEPSDNDWAVDVSPKTLLVMARSYFPITIVDRLSPICDGCAENQCGKDNLKEHAQAILELLHRELNMFETPRQLYENLLISNDVPGSRMDRIDDKYQRKPLLYKSLKKETFICKLDVFLILETMVYKLDVIKDPITQSLLALYLKAQEEGLGGTMEFVKWTVDLEKKVFKDFETKFSKLQKGSMKAECSMDKLIEDVRRTLVNDSENHDDDSLEQILKQLIDDSGSDVKHERTRTIHSLLKSLQAIINAYPALFLPNRNTPDIKKTKVVRIFNELGRQFVMRAEMDRAGFPLGGGRDDMQTMQASVALQLAMKQVKNGGEHIEFIIYPILRAKHKSAPITTPSGKLCKLAADVFYEFMYDLILGLKIFLFHQEDVRTYFNGLEGFFPQDRTDPLFMSTEKIQILTRKAIDHFNPVALSKCPQEALKIRDEYAKKVWDASDKEVLDSIGKTLEEVPIWKRTTNFEQDMIMSYIQESSPLAEFLHNQRACYRIDISKCSFCLEDPAGKKSEQKSILKCVLEHEQHSESEPNLGAETTLSTPSESAQDFDHISDSSFGTEHESITLQHCDDTQSATETSVFVTSITVTVTSESCLDPDSTTDAFPSEMMEQSNRDLDDALAKVAELEEKLREIDEKLRCKTEQHDKSIEKMRSKLKTVNDATTQLKQDNEKQLRAAKANNKDLSKTNSLQNTLIKDLREQLDQQQKINQKIEWDLDKNIKKAQKLDIVQQQLSKEKELTQKLKLDFEECHKKVKNLEKTQKKFADDWEILVRDHRRHFVTLEKMYTNQVDDVKREVHEKCREIETLKDSLKKVTSRKTDVRMLTELRAKKSRATLDDPVGEATKLVNKLVSRTSNESMKKRAKKELKVFTEKFDDYMSVVQKNIDILKSATNLPAVPELPALSKTFFDDYDKARKEYEAMETDCLICLAEVSKRDRTPKCPCKKLFHSKCLNDWKAVNPICPNCRRPLK